MLADFERKILRILYNYSHVKRHMPRIRELQIKTGYTETVVRRALTTLAEQEFITWDGKFLESIRIIRAWEQEDQPRGPDAMKYWPD